MKPFCHPAGDQEVPGSKVMVMYEDQAAGDRAALFPDTLFQESGPWVHLTGNRWMFSLLYTPLLREQAAFEAAMANIIIASVSGSTDLTAAVQDWLNCWLDHKENRPYVLAVLPVPQPKGQQINDPLVSLVKNRPNGQCEVVLRRSRNGVARFGKWIRCTVCLWRQLSNRLEVILTSRGREAVSGLTTRQKQKPAANIEWQDSAPHAGLIPENEGRLAGGQQESWLAALDELPTTLTGEDRPQSFETMGPWSSRAGHARNARAGPEVPESLG